MSKIKKFKKSFLSITLSFLIIFSLLDTVIANENDKNLLWKTSPGSYFSERFFDGTQITKNNIKDLDKFWTFNSGAAGKLSTVQSPPIFIGDQLILVTLDGHLVSISPKNGKL